MVIIDVSANPIGQTAHCSQKKQKTHKGKVQAARSHGLDANKRTQRGHMMNSRAERCKIAHYNFLSAPAASLIIICKSHTREDRWGGFRNTSKRIHCVKTCVLVQKSSILRQTREQRSDGVVVSYYYFNFLNI